MENRRQFTIRSPGRKEHLSENSELARSRVEKKRIFSRVRAKAQSRGTK